MDFRLSQVEKLLALFHKTLLQEQEARDEEIPKKFFVQEILSAKKEIKKRFVVEEKRERC